MQKKKKDKKFYHRAPCKTFTKNVNKKILQIYKMTDPLPCISLYIGSLRKWFNVVYNLNMLILQIVV
jgi:hypothetical protein